MMSGEPRGLRARDWKIAPDIPKEAPTSTAVIARGSLNVRMMNSASLLPPPNSVAKTSPKGIGKSPTLIDQQPMAKIATARPQQMATARVSNLVETKRLRTTTPRIRGWPMG